MSGQAVTLDPISLEIIANGLRSITDECFAALMRSAYSTNIKERRDHSIAIIDPRGRLVVQAVEALPIHIASMSGLMRCLMEKYGAAIEDGDLFVANDPHTAGGTHLPDINYAMPIFIEGELVAFVCNIAHHADVGGMAPGSMAGGMSEIYQEGLRIPVIKLFRRGELQTDIMDLLLLNVRVPRERRGDHNAQIAACRLGARRFREVVASHGLARVQTAFDEIIQRTNQRMRAAIAEIPDGTYHFADMLDGDGVAAFDIPIRLALTIDGETARCDFNGTSAQVAGNVNVTMNATAASVCYALKAVLDPGSGEQPGRSGCGGDRRRAGHAAQRQFPGACGGAGAHLPAYYRRGAGGAGQSTAGQSDRGRQRRQYHRRIFRRGPAHRPALPLPGNAGRRYGRAAGQRRQRRRTGAYYEYV